MLEEHFEKSQYLRIGQIHLEKEGKDCENRNREAFLSEREKKLFG